MMRQLSDRMLDRWISRLERISTDLDDEIGWVCQEMVDTEWRLDRDEYDDEEEHVREQVADLGLREVSLWAQIDRAGLLLQKYTEERERRDVLSNHARLIEEAMRGEVRA
ncbi:hypothetical protein [Sagittula sp.]|uniref:hypothetical protein n=1 Tax=Sagittula sp. TaxID=2038081 RepID=UPI00351418D4